MTTRRKPRLGFWDIWNMSFGFLGIQFGFALQTANVSRIFETLGAAVEDIPVLWLAAPVTGLIVQPIIGYYSDRTWTRLGRRRPYFLAGAILASICLVIMPNSPALWVAAGMLWLMDTSFNVSMEPFRAFVGDNLPDEQRTLGFAMQSFFIGLGAVVASFMPYILTNWLGVSNEAPEGIIPDSVKWSFYLGAAVFLGAIIWTVVKSKEYPPEELEAFAEAEAGTSGEDNTSLLLQAASLQRAFFFLAAGLIMTWWVWHAGWNKELYILAVGMALAGVLVLVARRMVQQGNGRLGFVTMVADVLAMPRTMRQLAWVQFFSWFALFAMWIYTTAAVTHHIYGSSDPSSAAYNEGANWVGVCFGVYNGVAMLVAFLLPVLARATSRKVTHALCLLMGAIGLTSIWFIRQPEWLLLSMVGIGFAWASILSMPYAILTAALPADKMGYYMGVFNFFIVIPQIVAAAVLGFVIGRFFEGDAIYAMWLGGTSYLLAALLTLRVEDRHG
ncbi:MAG: MFS transporter [Bacteroidetes bacterium]|nr:MAG: MFS transporter [Bacteroidota bacterium]